MTHARWSALSLLTAGLLLAAQAAVAGGPPEGPVLGLHGRTEMEIDLKQIVGDLVPPLIEAAAVRDDAKAEAWRQMLELIGVFGLDRLELDLAQDLRESRGELTITLDPDAAGSLLFRTTELRSGRFRFARYLRRDDLALAASVTDLRGTARLALDLLSDPRVRGALPLLREDEEGNPAIGGIAIDRDLLPLLGGELDLVVLRPDPDAALPWPAAALVIGAEDGPALADAILKMLADRLGPGAAAMLSELPAEQVGDFEFHVLPMGMGYAVSDDFLVFASNLDRLRDLLAAPRGDLHPPRALRYVWFDVQRLVKLATALAGMWPGRQAMENPVENGVLEALAGSDRGAAEIVLTTRPGRLKIDTSGPGDWINVQYRIYRALAEAAPAQAARALADARYRQDAGRIDAAMTAYAEDHDGTYPQDVQDLVADGELDALPDLRPLPLGAYAPDGCTYVPLRDEEGTVTGYYFFVFGNDPHGGYDVFTPENVSEPDDFVIGRDGVPDGVITFCYDGTAVPAVEAWSEE